MVFNQKERIRSRSDLDIVFILWYTKGGAFVDAIIASVAPKKNLYNPKNWQLDPENRPSQKNR